MPELLIFPVIMLQTATTEVVLAAISEEQSLNMPHFLMNWESEPIVSTLVEELL